ncbi:DNA polymerase IV [Limibacillus halophilus]
MTQPANQEKTLLCRDCGSLFAEPPPGGRCPSCRGHRLVAHEELSSLSIAHIDCDAFYASVEKRDNPELADKPVIVGGGRRGVVSAACYVARIYGVRSAMPMFKALKACPDAVVIKPNMAKYAAVGREIRELMLSLTPLVEPISIDEAFLDLTGTEKLHGGPPARSLALLVKRIEREQGVSASIGLSHNKFLAKVASDLDKPRGFALIGKAETLNFLADKPVSIIWGVGKALQRALEREGITLVRHLLPYEETELMARYGSMGQRLYRFSRGLDERKINPESETKSISSETTFNEDITEFEALRKTLWPLCEKVARRLKDKGFAGRGVTLKLKTADFRIITRSRHLDGPTRLAEVLYREGADLLKRECDGRRFRLIGIGAQDLTSIEEADQPSLLEPERARMTKLADAMDSLRDKLGGDAVVRGRSFKPEKPGR